MRNNGSDLWRAWSGVAEFVDLSTAQNIGGNKTFDNNVIVAGDLTINGNTTTVSSTNTTISDKLIELATGTTSTPSGDAGLVIERGSEDNIFIGYDESADEIRIGQGTFTGASTGNLTITDTPVRLGNKVSIANSNNVNVNNELHVLFGSTANTNETELFKDGSSTRINIATNTTAMFEADVVGRNQAGNRSL